MAFEDIPGGTVPSFLCPDYAGCQPLQVSAMSLRTDRLPALISRHIELKRILR